MQVLSTEDLPGAYKFLTRHFINKKQYDDAGKYAQKCCDYAEVTRVVLCAFSVDSFTTNTYTNAWVEFSLFICVTRVPIRLTKSLKHWNFLKLKSSLIIHHFFSLVKMERQCFVKFRSSELLLSVRRRPWIVSLRKACNTWLQICKYHPWI